MSEQNLSQEELAYKEAFEKALGDSELPDGSQNKQDDSTKDSSSEKEPTDAGQLSKDEWHEKEIAQTIQNVKEQYEQEEQQPRRRGRPRKEEVNEYEKLYSEYKQNAEAQLGLYKTRLQQLAQDYQELKAKHEQKQEEPEQLPDDVKEVFEMYPDIGKAMSAYVNSQINKVKKSFTQDVEQQIKPIRSHLVLSDVQKHEMAVKAAHPDLQSILSSGDLTRWIETLPPVMKAGAQQVYQYGDTDSVIALLDEYKKQRGISNAPRSTRKQPGSRVRGTSSQENEGYANGTESNSQLLGMASGPGYRNNDSSSDDNWEGGRGGYYGNSGPGRDGEGRGNGNSYSDDSFQDDDPLVQRVMAALAVKSNRTPVDINNAASRNKQKTAEDIFKEMTAEYEKDVSRFRRR